VKNNRFLFGCELGLAIVASVGVSLQSKLEPARGRKSSTAAFRDGLYQAKLDVQDGRVPRLRTGRWSNHADRAVL